MIEQWMEKFLNFEKTPQKNIFWLDTMRFFCGKLDDVQNSFNAFHVAGSKGKGSVSAMICSILEEYGIKTGLYTSPHILNFYERITENTKFLPQKIYDEAERILIQTVEKFKNDEFLQKRPVTWFELCTLYSFLCFKKAEFKWAVYEVGLGGRLDSTNVLLPQMCCITPIELEHTEFLGDTLEKIAGEKAGIIKEGIPVVCSKQQEEAKKVILKKAEEKKSPIYFTEDFFSPPETEYLFENGIFKGEKITLKSKKLDIFINFITSMPGKFQAENAETAVLAVKKVFPDIDEKTIERGLSKAVLPARFEILRNIKGFENIPSAVIDGAHTVKSMNFTVQTFSEIFGNQKAVLLFACAKDKDCDDMAKLFGENFRIFLTVPGNVKQSDLGKISDSFKKCGRNFSAGEDFISQIQNAFFEAEKEHCPILVTGSFYLAAEVKKFLSR